MVDGEVISVILLVLRVIVLLEKIKFGGDSLLALLEHVIFGRISFPTITLVHMLELISKRLRPLFSSPLAGLLFIQRGKS